MLAQHYIDCHCLNLVWMKNKFPTKVYNSAFEKNLAKSAILETGSQLPA